MYETVSGFDRFLQGFGLFTLIALGGAILIFIISTLIRLADLETDVQRLKKNDDIDTEDIEKLEARVDKLECSKARR